MIGFDESIVLLLLSASVVAGQVPTNGPESEDKPRNWLRIASRFKLEVRHSRSNSLACISFKDKLVRFALSDSREETPISSHIYEQIIEHIESRAERLKQSSAMSASVQRLISFMKDCNTNGTDSDKFEQVVPNVTDEKTADTQAIGETASCGREFDELSQRLRSLEQQVVSLTMANEIHKQKLETKTQVNVMLREQLAQLETASKESCSQHKRGSDSFWDKIVRSRLSV